MGKLNGAKRTVGTLVNGRLAHQAREVVLLFLESRELQNLRIGLLGSLILWLLCTFEIPE
jgi:hypothetical protein